MTNEVPDIETLSAKLAELHMKGVSPNGVYGFPVPTYQGALTQPNTWTDSWEKFFTEMLQRCFHWEQEMHG
jgi:protein-ribulosamine 3-kinase